MASQPKQVICLTQRMLPEFDQRPPLRVVTPTLTAAHKSILGRLATGWTLRTRSLVSGRWTYADRDISVRHTTVLAMERLGCIEIVKTFHAVTGLPNGWKVVLRRSSA